LAQCCYKGAKKGADENAKGAATGVAQNLDSAIQQNSRQISFSKVT
jgi:hypothetical protein